MEIQYAVRSERGLKRSKNEDSYRVELCDTNTSKLDGPHVLLAVADGMGGHPCGEVASKMACGALNRIIDTLGGKSEKEIHNSLVKKFYEIDDHIRVQSIKKKDCSHMGTTLSVIVISGEKGVVAHIGDSRIYCLRNGQLELLTTDHTFTQEMFEKGVFTAEMVKESPHRNVLTQVVGTEEPIENVYTRVLDIISGDRLLLSSDGLHDIVSIQEIERMMKEGDGVEETALRLITHARAKGGKDDITVIVVHFGQEV